MHFEREYSSLPSRQNAALEKKLAEMRGGKKLVTVEEKQRAKRRYDVGRVSNLAINADAAWFILSYP